MERPSEACPHTVWHTESRTTFNARTVFSTGTGNLSTLGNQALQSILPPPRVSVSGIALILLSFLRAPEQYHHLHGLPQPLQVTQDLLLLLLLLQLLLQLLLLLLLQAILPQATLPPLEVAHSGAQVDTTLPVTLLRMKEVSTSVRKVTLPTRHGILLMHSPCGRKFPLAVVP